MDIIEIFIFKPIFHVIQWCNGALKPNWAEIHRVRQVIVPFGTAAPLTIIYIDKHTKQGNGYR